MRRLQATVCCLLSLLCLMLPVIASADTPRNIFRTASNAVASGDIPSGITLFLSIPEPANSGDEEGRDLYLRSRSQVAGLYMAIGKPEAALSICEAVLKHYPEHTEIRNLKIAVSKSLDPAWKQFLSDASLFLPSLFKGTVMTLLLVLCTMFISPIGGLLIALGRISRFKLLAVINWFIIWFFRGTPLLLQLFFIYYGLPALLDITLSPVTAAIIGLGLNYSAYLGEIIRGAILSIEGGQMEAAKAIGMSYGQAMRRVIIPQTYKRLVPPVGNEFIALIKDTALVSTIAMVELMRSADQLFNTYFNVSVLILAAMIYLSLTTVFTLIFEHIEKKVGIYEVR
ncbi:MAG: amino acid ABC transporter permease [Deltaproteobacteria bacterium]|nr:MAG: amino acid ABC transporter permease [Deltaproteobacteria bacterium]